MGLKKNNPGCDCCEEEAGCEISVSVRVQTEDTNRTGGQACGTTTFLAGATVEVRRDDTDALVGSGVSDGSGNVTITFTDPDHPGTGTDTYRIRPGKAPRWSAVGSPATHALACGPNGVFNVLVGPAAGYRCVLGTSAEPVKASLVLTDALGTWTAVHNDSAVIPPGLGVWRACYTISQTGQQVWNGSACQTGVTATVAVEYQLQPAGAGKWQVQQKWTHCPSPQSGTSGAPGTCDSANRATLIAGPGGSRTIATTGAVLSAEAPGSACSPVNLTFTMPAFAHVAGSVSVTE